jgi:HPt (histidine-containing phosphotransfer) domain-containing protein
MDGYVTKPVEADRLVAAVESAAGSFSFQAVAARLGDDRQLLRELIELFLAECPGMIEAIGAAIAASDAAALRHAAHALKGSVANFGATPAVAAARKLEKIGIEGDLSGAAAAFSELTQALDDFRREVSHGGPS